MTTYELINILFNAEQDAPIQGVLGGIVIRDPETNEIIQRIETTNA